MAAPQIPDEVAGNGFGLVHRVAQSPLGDLWLALDQRGGLPGEPVLLRQVSLAGGATADTRERVASAGRTAMSLRSELLLPVVDVLEQDPLAVAYAYVEAQPLSALQSAARARELSFPVGVALRVSIDLLRALQLVHESWPGWPTEAPFGGLLPASVLVGRDGRTRLCDALVASSALLQRGFDLSAAELAYRAPEQVYASTAPEPATDVFIAAIVLWELLAGRRLLSGRKETIERKLLEHDLPKLSAEVRRGEPLSRSLQQLVDRSLSLDPSQRPQTPGAFAAALERCGHDVASHEQVAAFVSELAGPQMERAARIVSLALGYAAGASVQSEIAEVQSEIAADQMAAQLDSAPSQPEVRAPRSDVARKARPSVPPPPLPSARPLPAAPSLGAGLPPLPPPRSSQPPAAPAGGVTPTRSLAAALARTFERHRASQPPPPPPAEPSPGAPRATSLGIGAAYPPLARPAQPPSAADASSPVATAAPGQVQPPVAGPAVPGQPVLPVMASMPPLQLLRRRAPAAEAPASELGPDALPPSSAETTTKIVERVPVRAYSPPAPIRLAPKRALLAAMASVVLLLQLWMFELARSQPRKTSPDGSGTESGEGNAPSALSPESAPDGEQSPTPATDPELSEAERPPPGAKAGTRLAPEP